jgi:Rieske Fe-S protein
MAMAQLDRRNFLRATASFALALTALGLSADDARAIGAPAGSGAEHRYPLPVADGVTVDRSTQVIIVRAQNHAYAFALSCPHQNTALRWLGDDGRFQCPKHKSKYQPDGTFISGRATRNMDRFPIRKDGKSVVVNLAKIYESDKQRALWDQARVSS